MRSIPELSEGTSPPPSKSLTTALRRLALHARRYSTPVSGVLFAAFLAFTSIYAYRNPLLNWDMVAYVGVVESYKHHDPVEVYRATIHQLKPLYDEEAFYRLTHKNRLSNNPKAFDQHLPFYYVKPLYTGTMWLLSEFGMPLYLASYLLSIVGFLLIAGVCYYFQPQAIGPTAWRVAFVAFACLGSWPLIEVARLSVPDLLGVGLYLLGFCFFVYRKSFAVFAACVLLAQLARGDVIVLTLFLCIYFAWAKAIPLRRAALLGASALAVHFVCTQLSGFYGWKAQIYYVFFINRTAYPAEMVPVFSAKAYLHLVWDNSLELLRNPRLVVLLLASALAVGLQWARPLANNMFAWLIVVNWLAFAARFAVYPNWWEDRYFYANYVLLLICLAEILPHHFRRAVATFRHAS